MKRPEQMRKPHFEVGQKRKVRARTGDLLEIQHGGKNGLLEDGSLGKEVAPRPGENGPSREGLPALESYELREGDIDPVLAGYVLGQSSPACQTDGATRGVVAGNDTAGWARAWDDDHLSAVECSQHGRERMPGVLADENGRPAPSGIEGLHATPGFDKSLLVEHAIGWQEDFPVDVADAGIGTAQRSVEAGIVESVPVDLIKPERDVHRVDSGFFMLAAEVIEELIGRDGQVPHTALEEVTSECGFRSHDEVRWLGPSGNLPEERPESAKILLIRPLVGPHLGYGEAEHVLKVISYLTVMTTAFQAVSGVANACQILPTVITGGQPNAAQLRALKEAGGGIVLDLRVPMEPRPVDESTLVRELGMEYVNVPVRAGSLDDATLERILAVLRGAGDRTVFFHCGSGNRVGGALLPYFILDQAMEEQDAVDQAMRVGLRSAEMMEWGLDYARRHKGG
jgi:protein tyrosine phosphatase (PTP) superfamily phosphohydrolase (DUF442 family)